VNNGGDMVENTIRMLDPDVAYTAVHASRGKGRRAEPVAALYEARPGHPTGKIRHCGAFPELEDQLCELTIDFDTDTAGYSPDRADAMIWGFTELFVEGPAPLVISQEFLQAAAATRRIRGLLR
jgi:phage terminase large subunit-like protein